MVAEHSRTKWCDIVSNFLHIDMTNEELQTKKISLSHCHYALKFLVEKVCKGFNDSESPFFCFLKNRYISQDVEILHNSLFESRVCKSQDNCTAAMSNAEKNALKSLFLPVEETESDDGMVLNSMKKYRQRLHCCKRRKICSEKIYEM